MAPAGVPPPGGGGCLIAALMGAGRGEPGKPPPTATARQRPSGLQAGPGKAPPGPACAEAELGGGGHDGAAGPGARWVGRRSPPSEGSGRVAVIESERFKN